jgi:hypothetical protein
MRPPPWWHLFLGGVALHAFASGHNAHVLAGFIQPAIGPVNHAVTISASAPASRLSARITLAWAAFAAVAASLAATRARVESLIFLGSVCYWLQGLQGGLVKITIGRQYNPTRQK